MCSLGRVVVLCVAVAVSAAFARPAGAAEPARPADAFVDSIGVNVHMNYQDTVYLGRTRLIDALTKAGIRHVRDGLSWDTAYAYDTYNRMAARGIHVTYIMGDPSERNDTLDELLTVLRTRVRGAAEAVEGPNEYSYSGDPLWASQLRAYQQRLYTAIKDDPALAALPVVAPSLISWQDHAAVGDMRGALDFGNKHAYPGGDIPEANLDNELSVASRVSGERPVWVTESGYHNALATTGGHRPTSEAATATYLPRMYLEYFRRGIERTFAYELIDEWPDAARQNQEANFGLLRNDYSEKPSFGRLTNLISVLADPGPAFSAQPLDLSVESAPGDLRRLLLQKRDGTYFLVLWRAARVWDPVARAAVGASASPVTLRLGAGALSRLGAAAVIDPGNSSQSPAPLPLSGTVRMSVGAEPLILRLSPSQGDTELPAAGPDPAVPAEPAQPDTPAMPAAPTPTPSTTPATSAALPTTVTAPSARAFASSSARSVRSSLRLLVPRNQRIGQVLRRGLFVHASAAPRGGYRVTAARGGSVVAQARGHAGSARFLRLRLTPRGTRTLRLAAARGWRVGLQVRLVSGGRSAIAVTTLAP